MPQLLPPGFRVPPFIVAERMGAGGMATVYRLEHEILCHVAVLKVLHLRHRRLRKRLLREGRIQANLQHPNVVRVHDLVDIDGQVGLVLEYVDGGDLDQLIRRGRMPLDRIDRLATGIARGLSAAHAAGVVHRDLKPANILLHRVGVLTPKIADFGLATPPEGDSDRLTRVHERFGTPAYMAPEQCAGARDVDARADIFAFGCVLYEMLTGRRAFPDLDERVIRGVAERVPPVPVATLRPDAPARMVEAVGAALQLDVRDRPRSCAALMQIWRSGTPRGVFVGGRGAPRDPAPADAPTPPPSDLPTATPWSTAAGQERTRTPATEVAGAFPEPSPRPSEPPAWKGWVRDVAIAVGLATVAVAIAAGTGAGVATLGLAVHDALAPAPDRASPAPARAAAGSGFDPPAGTCDDADLPATGPGSESPTCADPPIVADPGDPRRPPVRETARRRVPPPAPTVPFDAVRTPPGCLTVRSEDGRYVSVTVEGVLDRYAPMPDTSVPVGRHALTLGHAPLGWAETLEIDVAPGRCTAVTVRWSPDGVPYAEVLRPVSETAADRTPAADPERGLRGSGRAPARI